MWIIYIIHLCIMKYKYLLRARLPLAPPAHPAAMADIPRQQLWAQQRGGKPVCWEGAVTAWTGTCWGPSTGLPSQLHWGCTTSASCVSSPHLPSSHPNMGVNKALSFLEKYLRIRPYYGNAEARERRRRHYIGFFSLSQLNECSPKLSCPALVCAVTIVSKNSVWFFKQFLTKQALSEKS